MLCDHLAKPFPSLQQRRKEAAFSIPIRSGTSIPRSSIPFFITLATFCAKMILSHRRCLHLVCCNRGRTGWTLLLVHVTIVYYFHWTISHTACATTTQRIVHCFMSAISFRWRQTLFATVFGMVIPCYMLYASTSNACIGVLNEWLRIAIRNRVFWIERAYSYSASTFRWNTSAHLNPQCVLFRFLFFRNIVRLVHLIFAKCTTFCINISSNKVVGIYHCSFAALHFAVWASPVP